MLLYKVLSTLLDYPDQELLDALPEVNEALSDYPEALQQLRPLLDFLSSRSVIAVQENYVATFDRNPAHSLHLFEHVHGESRDRGQAMVDLLNEYQQHGFDLVSAELPDYIPLFLEFLSLQQPEQSQELLDQAIHVLAAIGNRLATNQSPYATIFAVLRTRTDVQPEEQEMPPVRDMDEALEMFGVGNDGAEPLLHGNFGGEQVVRFHPRTGQRSTGESA